MILVEMKASIQDYEVYGLVFPDGRKYFGASANSKGSWANEGAGYRKEKVWQAIKQYPWSFVRKELLLVTDYWHEAEEVRDALILYHETADAERGWNGKVSYESVRKLPTYETGLPVKEIAKRYLEVLGLLSYVPRPLEEAEDLVKNYEEESEDEVLMARYKEMAMWQIENYTEAMINPLPEYDKPLYQEVYNELFAERERNRELRKYNRQEFFRSGGFDRWKEGKENEKD